MGATVYPAFWVTATALAAAVAIWQQARLVVFRRDYWQWLLVPWKLATFALAMAGLIVVAPFMRDPFWDRADAAFMSILTFVTAPWAVGVLWRALFRKGSILEAYVALCAGLFSASWSFDLYQSLRLGTYPDVWWLNLLASSSLYLIAGVFWNLDWSPDRGATFAFLDPHWPVRRTGSIFKRILLPATLLMVCVTIAVIAPFVWDWR